MGFLGIDVGTTGCKVGLFSETGEMLTFAYQEYTHQSPQAGWAQLDAVEVWNKVKLAIQTSLRQVQDHKVKSLSISSMGEALVPVSLEREILAPSILNFDIRGAEYLQQLSAELPEKQLYAISGNTLGNHFSLTKMMWMRDHLHEVYKKTEKWLPWSAFVAFMLGARPTVDLSQANRMLLLDVDRRQWSQEIIRAAQIDPEILPEIVPSGEVIGTVDNHMADELGLQHGVVIVSGGHDQCINAVGCGAISGGRTLLGMGTFICASAVFDQRMPSDVMMDLGLNTEHHAVPGKFITFIYNQGGSIVKWYRDTFARLEHQQSLEKGDEIYRTLFSEIPASPSRLFVLPSFASGGLPDFNAQTAGVIAGLKLETRRAEILKAIIESVIFDIKETIEKLVPTGITIEDLRVVGGGSKSEKWVQICADILGKPLVRPIINEAGALGAAITAAVGSGHFASFKEGVEAMVQFEKTFEPHQEQVNYYKNHFESYLELKSLLRKFLNGRY